MGWNDHHPGISPDDPDPGETLRAQADLIRTEQKEAGGCPTCGSPERFARRMVGYHFPHAEPCKDGWGLKNPWPAWLALLMTGIATAVYLILRAFGR